MFSVEGALIELAAEPGGQRHRFTATAVAGPLNIGASAVFTDSEILFMRRQLSPDPFRSWTVRRARRSQTPACGQAPAATSSPSR